MIPRAEVERLLRAFYAIDFFRLRDRYEGQRELTISPDGTVHLMEQMISDLPTRILTIRIGDYEKQVVDYFGAPAGVSALATLMDEVAGTARWVGGSDAAGAGPFVPAPTGPTERVGLQVVEAPTGTILVANMSANTVWFVDAATGVRRAMITTRAAPHEVAVSSDGLEAVVTNYGGQGATGNLVQVLDVVAGTVVREWAVEGYQRLHGAAYLPGDSLLALTSERTSEILIVSVADGAIRKKLSTGGQSPHMLALGGRWIFAANMGSGSVSRMARGAPGGMLSVPADAGAQTEGVAATPDGREVWTASMATGVVVGIDIERGEQVARVEGLQVPYRLAATADGSRIVVSDPEAQEVVVIDRSTGSLSARVDISAAASAAGLGATTSPQGFILSPDSRWAFVAVQGIQQVAVIDLETNQVVDFHPSGAAPDGIAFSPVGG